LGHLTADKRTDRVVKFAPMLRKYLVFQHRWTGLLMTAFLAVVGLTGSILAFSPQLDRWINPQLHVRHGAGQKPLDLATLAEKAEDLAGPKALVGYFTETPDPDQVLVHLSAHKDPKTGNPYALGFNALYLDPYTGRELGRGFWHHTTNEFSRVRWESWVLAVHETFFMVPYGGTVVGYVAVVWTIDCFVGFYLTLPLGLSGFLKRWKLAWWVKWRAGTFRLNYDLHRASGLWLWPLLFIFAWSGVMFNFGPVYYKVMGKLFPSQSIEEQLKTLHPVHETGHPKLTWSQILPICEKLTSEQAKLKGFTVVRPLGMGYCEHEGFYSYSFLTQEDLGGRTLGSFIQVDGDTGELQLVYTPKTLLFGNRIDNWLYSLHWADFHDQLWFRLVVFLLGLAMVGLSVTGIYVWWKKRETRVLIKRRAAAF